MITTTIESGVIGDFLEIPRRVIASTLSSTPASLNGGWTGDLGQLANRNLL
jgi:hypothetical protein